MYGADLQKLVQSSDNSEVGVNPAGTLLFDVSIASEGWHEIWANIMVITQANVPVVAIRVLDQDKQLLFIFERVLQGVGADLGSVFAGRRWYLQSSWRFQMVILTAMAGGDNIRGSLTMLQLRNLDDPTAKETTSGSPSELLGRTKTAVSS